MSCKGRITANKKCVCMKRVLNAIIGQVNKLRNLCIMDTISP